MSANMVYDDARSGIEVTFRYMWPEFSSGCMSTVTCTKGLILVLVLHKFRQIHHVVKACQEPF
jgi:hypothetical protein